MSIFKAYDIRGLYGDEMDETTAEQIGRAFVLTLADIAGKEPGDLRIGLGRDMRLTAPAMAAAYLKGMTSEGAHVIDAGEVATEMLYFLVGSRELDGGAMCTASHNPKAYTGVKLVSAGALPLSGDAGIGDIRKLVEAGMDAAPGAGSSEEVDLWDEYRASAEAFIDPTKIKPMKIVVDGGNGMAGPMVGPILEELDLDLITSYWKPNGNFPDHEPNPLLPENREFIIKKVKAEGAVPGDADRWHGVGLWRELCGAHDLCLFVRSQETDCSGERRNGDSLVGEDLAGERDQFDTLAGQFVVVGDPVAQP